MASASYQVVLLIDDSLLSSDTSQTEIVTRTTLRILTYFADKQQQSVCQELERTSFSTGTRNKQDRILYEATDTVNGIEWGYAFFSSSTATGDTSTTREAPATGIGSLREFSLRSFEEFLDVLKSRRMHKGVVCNKTPPQVQASHQLTKLVSSLKSSLQRLTLDFAWNRPDVMTSPIRSSLRSFGRHTKEESSRENYLFVITDCPQCTPIEMKNCVPTSKQFIDSLLPPLILNELKNSLRLKLFLIDTSVKISTTVHHRSCQSSTTKPLFNEALSHLEGRVIPVAAILGNYSTIPMHDHSSTLSSKGPGMTTGICRGTMKIEEPCESSIASDLGGLISNEILPIPSVAENISRSILPCSTVLNYYLHKPLPNEPKLDDNNQDFILLLDCNVFQRHILSNPSSLFHVSIKPITRHSVDLYSLIAAERPDVAKLSGVAVLSADTLPLTWLQYNAVYLVMAKERYVEDEEEVDSSDELTTVVRGRYIEDSAILKFAELIMRLSSSNEILLIKVCDGTSLGPKYGVLRHLTTTTATLTLCDESIASKIDKLLDGVAVDNSVCNETVFPPQSRRDRRCFDPSMLEAWYDPVCSTITSDALIDELDLGLESFDRSEKSLLRRLARDRQACNAAASPVFPSPRLVSSAHTTSVHSVSLTAQPSELLGKNSVVRNGRDVVEMKSGGRRLRETPNKRGERHVGKTPRKSTDPANGSGNSTGRTPRKVASGAGNNSRRLTPCRQSKATPPFERTKRSRNGSDRNSSDIRTSRPSSSPPAKRARDTLHSCKQKTKTIIEPRVSQPPASRTARIVQMSKEALARRLSSMDEDSNSGFNGVPTQVKGQLNGMASIDAKNSVQNNASSTSTAWQDWKSVDDVVDHIATVYRKVAEFEGTPLIGAKMIFHAVKQFFQSTTDPPSDDCLKDSCDLIRKHVVVSSSRIREKFKGQEEPARLEYKLREYELQILLQFELDSATIDSSSTIEETATEIVSMLRAISFVKDPAFLASYLQDVLLCNYLSSSPHLLYKVFDELAQPIPKELEYFLSPDPDNDQSVPLPSISGRSNGGMMDSGMMGSAVQYCSSSDAQQCEATTRARRPIFRAATFDKQLIRQIQIGDNKWLSSPSQRRSARIASGKKIVKKLPVVTESVGCVKRALFDGNQVDNRHHESRRLSLPVPPPTMVSATSCPVLATTSNKCRYLTAITPSKRAAVKPHHVLKTRKVSETPAHRQGRNVALSRIERTRKGLKKEDLNVQVVEESPDKCSTSELSCSAIGGQPLLSEKTIAPSLIRQRSFYSSVADKQSRNVIKSQLDTKYDKLNDRFTRRVISPSTIGSIGKGNEMMSPPRRIKPMSLFGGIWSPSPQETRGRSAIISPVSEQKRERDVAVSVHCGPEATKMTTPRRAVCKTLFTGTTPLRIWDSRLAHPDVASSSSAMPEAVVGRECCGLDSPSTNTRLHRKNKTINETEPLGASQILSSPSELTTKEYRMCTGKKENQLVSPSQNHRFNARLLNNRSDGVTTIGFPSPTIPTIGTAKKRLLMSPERCVPQQVTVSVRRLQLESERANLMGYNGLVPAVEAKDTLSFLDNRLRTEISGKITSGRQGAEIHSGQDCNALQSHIILRTGSSQSLGIETPISSTASLGSIAHTTSQPVKMTPPMKTTPTRVRRTPMKRTPVHRGTPPQDDNTMYMRKTPESIDKWHRRKPRHTSPAIFPARSALKSHETLTPRSRVESGATFLAVLDDADSPSVNYDLRNLIDDDFVKAATVGVLDDPNMGSNSPAFGSGKRKTFCAKMTPPARSWGVVSSLRKNVCDGVNTNVRTSSNYKSCHDIEQDAASFSDTSAVAVGKSKGLDSGERKKYSPVVSLSEEMRFQLIESPLLSSKDIKERGEGERKEVWTRDGKDHGKSRKRCLENQFN